ncbi:DUF1415 domain-containing protein [Noviherbaspirillum pedocola]|uniref:DUF1415 domain-containing protein n=1 Tax=Noviherbaspirillum pedocola TaxID=2801341 RepID=A0A934W825_9BURK|nr:DUF1415 domain-containing protein [Noviherbaspirillum pedocola]MBK4738102.1 DUF1415 domain-containing protein [Noviherbaspirillum pedocola]
MQEQIIDNVKTWLERAVIGLNLCPFAKAVHTKGQIRYVVSEAQEPKQLGEELMRELKLLHACDPSQTDTTLLIHPWVLTDFFDYNEFLDTADEIVAGLDLEGEIQVASFHPHYQFADTKPEDIENYTNRAPYPMLHLLREASIEKAVAAFPDAKSIYKRNIATLRELGEDGWRRLFAESGG